MLIYLLYILYVARLGTNIKGPYFSNLKSKPLEPLFCSLPLTCNFDQKTQTMALAQAARSRASSLLVGARVDAYFQGLGFGV